MSNTFLKRELLYNVHLRFTCISARCFSQAGLGVCGLWSGISKMSNEATFAATGREVRYEGTFQANWGTLRRHFAFWRTYPQSWCLHLFCPVRRSPMIPLLESSGLESRVLFSTSVCDSGIQNPVPHSNTVVTYMSVLIAACWSTPQHEIHLRKTRARNPRKQLAGIEELA